MKVAPAADVVQPMTLDLVGADVQVPLVTGESRRYVNLDYSASTPSLSTVWDAVKAFMPWYSSVHRGAGFKSVVSTSVYEGARAAVRSFVGAPRDDVIVFTRNTTDAINLLASAMRPEDVVLVSDIEHHANLLPWRRVNRRVFHVPNKPEQLVGEIERSLRMSPAPVRLVAVTGASNVTGELWPLPEIARVAHAHGARLMVDAAQLAPHSPIDMVAQSIDYVAMSGHKLYAPFGAGALVGPRDWLSVSEPYLAGGGAVDFVTLDDVLWKMPPDREEAGSPNVVGAAAMGEACRALKAHDMEKAAEHEAALYAHARERLLEIPGVEVYTLWPLPHPHIGVLTFGVRGYHHSLIASILSAEFGIGVRHGCFCAHPLMVRLLHVERSETDRIRHDLREGERPELPGAIRMSFGLGTTEQDVDACADALRLIVTKGPAWTYRQDPASGEYVPDPDPRPWPEIPFMMERDAATGESS